MNYVTSETLDTENDNTPYLHCRKPFSDSNEGKEFVKFGQYTCGTVQVTSVDNLFAKCVMMKLVVIVDSFFTHIFKETKIGWSFETPFRCSNLDNKAPYVSTNVVR